MFHGSKYFAAKEFGCKCGCGFGLKEAHVARQLVDHLTRIREFIKRPVKITSAARCVKHNMAEGGAGASTHLPGGTGRICAPDLIGRCRAADIDTTGFSTEARGNIVLMSLAAGYRVGLGTTFIHIDVETGGAYAKGIWNYAAKENSSNAGE